MEIATGTTKIFVDLSGSTFNQAAYWKYVNDVVSGATGDSSFYVFDNTTRQLDRDALLRLVRSLGERDRGTRISGIPAFLRKDDAVSIITDGQVHQSEVEHSDALLEGMPLRSVHVHFVHTGGPMNLSVSAPFTRNTLSANVIVDGKKLAHGSTRETIDLQPLHGAPEKFLAAFDTLRATMALQHTGSRDAALRNAILDLQDNLLGVISAGPGPAVFDPIRASLVAGAYDTAAAQLKAVTATADATLSKSVADAINRLLRIVDGKDFSFANLVPTRIVRADPLDAADVAALPDEEDLSTLAFECPVSLDSDMPLCLVSRGPAVLAGLDKSRIEDLITNPLLFLLDPALLTALGERLDHLVGLDAMKVLFTRGQVVSPFTRRHISSALTFGSDAAHAKATNVALADLFFGNGKLVGQAELWLAVVYFAITHKRVAPYLDESGAFVAAFESHLVQRMRRAKTNLTLSGFPIAPHVKAPMDIAVWYCVASPFFADAQKEPTNRLRDFNATASYLIGLVDLLNYPYKKEETRHWMNLYHAFAWLMSQAKTADSQWRERLRAQYQNSTTANNGAVLVLLDGPATEASRPRLPEFGLSLDVLLGLAAMVDVSKKTNAIYMPYAPAALAVPPSVWNYAYPVVRLSDDFMPDLSPCTYRPVVIDRAARQHWAVCSVARYGPLKKQVSLYNYFIRFAEDHVRYPASQDEFIVYLARKQAAREDDRAMDTLPAHIRSFVDELFRNYERVLGAGFANVPVAEFIAVTNASRPEDRRKVKDGSESLLTTQ